MPEHLKRLAIDHLDLVVYAADDIEILLLHVPRRGDILGCARSVHLCFPYDLTLQREYLDAVIAAAADIEQPVHGQHNTMNRIAESIELRRQRIIIGNLRVIRLLAVSASIPLEFDSIRIENDEVLVQIAIEDKYLIGFGINENLRNAAKSDWIVSAVHVCQSPPSAIPPQCGNRHDRQPRRAQAAGDLDHIRSRLPRDRNRGSEI